MQVCLISGHGTFEHILARGLSDLGHTVTVLCWAEGSEGHSLEGKVQVHRVRPAKVWFIRGARLYWRYARQVVGSLEWSAGVYRAVRELRETGRFDIIVAPEYMVAGFYLSKYKLAPLVIVCHCLHEIFTSLNQSSNWFAQAIIARLERSMMKRADYLISPSVNLRQIIMRRHRLAGARFEVIPNPVDTDLFVPKPVSTNIPTVLYVGRLERLKGVYVLAEAIGLLARSYKDFRCIFIGRDSLTRDGRSVRAELSSKLERLGCLNQVQFIDHLERSHLVPYYQQADLCVVPSLYETCPYTVLEAMACGRPVVATNVGGIPEIIEDGLTGRLVPKEDSDQLAETIRELLSNPLERERLGKNARVHIEKHYSREVIARRYADLLERVINVSSVEAALL